MSSLHSPTQTDDALSQLRASADAAKHPDFAYGGEVSPRQTMAYLSDHAGMLVDVRTEEEWQSVGVPDLQAGNLLAISWKTNPGYVPNPQFAQQLASSAGVTWETPLFFICRSGGRSLDAAIAMTALGYRHCFNVTDGFEGDPDASGQRGRVNGWKAHLPWKQP